MKKIRVLIVDDSAFMRKILSDMLNKDYRIEVVGTARNGKDGLKKIGTLSPDVVTLDVEMPQMDGLEALERIMEECPVPVVMVSSLTKQGAESTIKAITLGAIDFIQKPSGPISLDMEKVEDQVVRKVLIAGKAKVGNASKTPASSAPYTKVVKKPTRLNKAPIIAIGTSTGGPRALDTVITNLPTNLPAPVLIVQHMPKGFTHSLAERLNRQASITVKEASHGDILQNGHAYIAPGGQHMTVVQRDGRLVVELDETEPLYGHRPSVNRMFQSLAHLEEMQVFSVIMTGMGADGTEGLMELKKNKPDTHSIAEAEESCIVFGMPKAVIKSGLADEIVPVSEISRRLLKAIGH
ncbi:chemotaxis response regulator protein-glutamate methylesterase [Halobacillus litoralis]|uniref:protein-glutamate methylesterase/protein-glutamine glutaminase n=1 Tax=Halobacillus litoralis TaxID=45668 RepID=UPI001CD38184|nr:chemotaxis response regulator protein-glutamate methylesterase [Halobacillus litoralis]MCA0969121.1 chemotaxis response regulator protein-glutamate methylesterase [Halobacillus litoralis]